MQSQKSLALLASIYLTTMVVGLHVGSFFLPLMYPPGGGEPVVQPAVSDPDSVSSSLHIFLYVLIVTAVVLLLMKHRLGYVIRAVMMLAFFSGMTFSLSSFIGDAGLLIALVLSVVLYFRRNSLVLTNVSLCLALSGIGGWFGASLSLVPALILLLVLAVYDFISVFITKHMVRIAEESKGDSLPLMFLIPFRERNLGIGTGDMVLPLVLTVSVFKDYGPGYAIPTAFGGLLGLVWLFYYIQGRGRTVLPALPPIAAGLFIGLGMVWAVFNLV
ncbi:MAG: presenilin family intramembrane aspartyl protease [Candidatus Altiarchaeota archaeon]